jgi:hypothetical protein
MCMFHITWHKSCILVTLDVAKRHVFQVFKINLVFPPVIHTKYHHTWLSIQFIFIVVDFLYCFWQYICGHFQLCYRLRQKTEISTNVGQVSFYHLQFIWVLKYVLQHCNRGGIIPVKLIYHRTKGVKVFYIIHSGIQPGSPPCNYWSWREWCVWSVVFKELYSSWQFHKDFLPISY